jgi:hypothetical protein
VCSLAWICAIRFCTASLLTASLGSISSVILPVVR